MSVEFPSSGCPKVADCLDRYNDPLAVLALAASVSAAVASAVWIGPNYPAQSCAQAACLLAGQAALIASHTVQGFRFNLKSAAFLIGQAAFGAGYGFGAAAISSQVVRGWMTVGGFILGITVPNAKCKLANRADFEELDPRAQPMISLDFPTPQEN